MTTQTDQLDAGLHDCLREVPDPEIGINVDLGLMTLARRTSETVKVRLTLTSRACPPGEMCLDEVTQKVAQSHPEVTRVDIRLVRDPVWTPGRITDRGHERLGRTRTRTLI